MFSDECRDSEIERINFMGSFEKIEKASCIILLYQYFWANVRLDKCVVSNIVGHLFYGVNFKKLLQDALQKIKFHICKKYKGILYKVQGDKKSTQQVNYGKTTPPFPKKSYW